MEIFDKSNYPSTEASGKEVDGTKKVKKQNETRFENFAVEVTLAKLN